MLDLTLIVVNSLLIGFAAKRLIIVKPETVIGWHRQGFRWYWTWKVRHGQSGRPRVPEETRDLIRTMSRDTLGVLRGFALSRYWRTQSFV